MRFIKKKMVGEPFRVLPCYLPEPLNRKSLGIDKNHAFPLFQAGDRGEHAEYALTTCRTTVYLGDHPGLESSPEQVIQCLHTGAQSRGRHFIDIPIMSHALFSVSRAMVRAGIPSS